MRWPNDSQNTDAVIKLYEAHTCGTANEAIGYTANALRGINQPRRGAILLLGKEMLPDIGRDPAEFVDPASGLSACWATSYEQNAKPFHYMRRLSTFTDKQSKAFYKSRFCQLLAGVDHITGNNDRHEGNFLYIDDLKYQAIDQGAIGGGAFWHTLWPDNEARNELLLLVQQNLSASQIAAWYASAILEYQNSNSAWTAIAEEITGILTNLLTPEQIATIITYMTARAVGNRFAESCGNLF